MCVPLVKLQMTDQYVNPARLMRWLCLFMYDHTARVNIWRHFIYTNKYSN